MLKGSCVLVTGGSSMIGQAVIQALEKRDCLTLYPRHYTYDFLDSKRTLELFSETRPEYVVHCAGYNGGIKFNKDFPADIYYRTTVMGLNVLDSCARTQVKKVISLISSCALPDDLECNPLKAENLWNGLPNRSVECHGLSKRNLHAFSRQINTQYGINAICVVLTNCFGPKDSFHPDKTKVVGAMIRRIVEAKEQNLPEITCWGTGSPKRELMYSLDAGEAIVQALENYDNVDIPLNIGSGVEVSIKELAEAVAAIIGYTGNINWDTTKQDGQMRKKLDTSNMHKYISFPQHNFMLALTDTINWYLMNREKANAKY